MFASRARAPHQSSMIEEMLPEALLAACLASFALIVWGLGRAVAAGSEAEAPAPPPRSRAMAFALAGARGANTHAHRRSASVDKLRHEVAADVCNCRTESLPNPALPTAMLGTATLGRRCIQIAEAPLQQRSGQGWTTARAPGAEVSSAKRSSLPEDLQRSLSSKTSSGKFRAKKAESSRSSGPGPRPPSEFKGPARRINARGSARSGTMPPRWPAMEGRRKSTKKLSSGTLFYTNVVKQELKRRRRESEEAKEDDSDASDTNGNEPLRGWFPFAGLL